MDSTAKTKLLVGFIGLFLAVFIIDAIIDRKFSHAATKTVIPEPLPEPRQTLEAVDPEPKIASYIDESQKSRRNRKSERKTVELPDSVEPPESASTMGPSTVEVPDETRLHEPEVREERPLAFDLPTPKPVKPLWPKNYVVQPGDHLTAIAKAYYGCSDSDSYPYVKKLFRANRRLLDSPNDLVVGQALIIPAPNSVGQTAVESAEETNSPSVTPRPRETFTETRPYFVQFGDNLAGIAKKFYGAKAGNKTSVIQQLFRVNRHRLKSPHLLKVGQKLTIPPLNSLTSQAVIRRLNPRRTIASSEVSSQMLGRLKKYTVRE